MNSFDGQSRKQLSLCCPNVCAHNTVFKVKKGEISLKCYSYVSLIHDQIVQICAVSPCEIWTKTSDIYTGDRGHVLNLQTSKGRLKPFCECTTHLLASPPCAPFPREGLAAGCKHWAVILEHLQGAKAFASEVCSTGYLGLGFPGGAKAFPWKKMNQNSHFLSHSLNAEGACRCQTCRPHLLRSMAEGRRCSSSFQLDKFSGWALNCSCMPVGRAGCFSCDHQQGRRPTEVKQPCREWLGLAVAHGGGHTRNGQTSVVVPEILNMGKAKLEAMGRKKGEELEGRVPLKSTIPL